MSTNLSTVTIEHYHDSTNSKLFVQTVTPMNQANSCAKGLHGSPAVNSAGTLEMNVLIGIDPDRPNFPFSTPVLHFIEIDTAPLNLGNFVSIAVSAYIEDELEPSGFRKIGDSTPTSSTANQGTRPLV